MTTSTTTFSRRLALLGAPSAIGIRPYASGEPRQVARAPAVLRELGLAARLSADDAGDVLPPPYVDLAMPPGRVRNEAGVAAYSRTLGERVAAAGRDGSFVLLLAGECSVVLGSLLGARQLADGGRAGLVYVDANADFATAEDTQTGSVAGMGLSFAIGRGASPLARLDPRGPLVAPDDVVVIGRRDRTEEAALRAAAIPELTGDELRDRGPAASAAAALESLARGGTGGFWIHLDADVIDPRHMPAVDSPEPGGPDLDTLAALLAPLVAHPAAIGLALTIFDPGLDEGGACAARLARLFEQLFGRAA